MDDRKTVYLIACGVLGPEIKHLVQSMGLELKMKFLPGKLHNTPDLLRTFLQAAIDEAAEDPLCSRIVIGYGLCGKGTVSVRATKVPLVFPQIHDCIALFLGSDRAYKEQFAKYPGTYYFTEGWHDEKEQRKKEHGKAVWVGDRAVGCAELEDRYGKKEAGTSEETVFVNIDDRHAQLKDGSSLFLERNIAAHLKGNPDLALQAEALVS